MRANPGKDTRPERRLRAEVHARGLRYRKNMLIRLEAGRARPDIVFPRQKIAVFLDGCFWHGCPEHGEMPVGNREFWRRKIEGNQARDAEQTEALQAAGWRVLRFWEHQSPSSAAAAIETVVRRRQSDASKRR